MRPSILNEVTPAASSAGSASMAARSEVESTRSSRPNLGAGDKPIAHAAGLAAAPAVAAAPADHAREETQARVAVAEGAVHEHLEVEAVWVERGDLVEGQLAGEDGALEAKLGQQGELGARVGVELRARVQREVGVAHAHLGREAKVGHDERVEAGLVRSGQRRERRLDLVVLEQRVEGEVDTGAEEMRAVDGLEQRSGGEVGREGARAPTLETQVDRVGAGRERGLQGRTVAGRREKFGFLAHRSVPSRPVQPAGAGRQAPSLTTLPCSSRCTRM